MQPTAVTRPRDAFASCFAADGQHVHVLAFVGSQHIQCCDGTHPTHRRPSREEPDSEHVPSVRERQRASEWLGRGGFESGESGRSYSPLEVPFQSLPPRCNGLQRNYG
jgi:hypothetical protein